MESPFRQTMIYLSMAIIVGAVVAMPLIVPRVVWSFHSSYQFEEMPESDQGLEAWLADQPRIVKSMVRRNADHSVSLIYSQLGRESASSPPFEALGYVTLRGAHLSRGVEFSELFRQPSIILTVLLAGQGGFLLAVIWWYRRDARGGRPRPPLHQGGTFRSLACGVSLGLGLLAFGLVYDEIVQRLSGGVLDTSGPWAAIRDLDSEWLLTLVLILGCVVAPVCEELFFRGGVLGCYLLVGRPWAGLAVSAVAFAGVHLDAVNFVAFCVYGLALGWAYRSTRSILAPITAHALNNGVAFWLILQGP